MRSRASKPTRRERHRRFSLSLCFALPASFLRLSSRTLTYLCVTRNIVATGHVARIAEIVEISRRLPLYYSRTLSSSSSSSSWCTHAGQTWECYKLLRLMATTLNLLHRMARESASRARSSCLATFRAILGSFAKYCYTRVPGEVMKCPLLRVAFFQAAKVYTL